ncbi:O-antigen ligase family protein [Alicyclobacillus tolerans]|uniref:O-antigen ligase family protein n=1 Tax=Alicyclobacillus tolerans TaxID=90970 RepID=UPI001F2AA72C|nr:O-antigen ligase family protein [Alicyclobacillus tolerans]MCF8567854.1 O-antigen ligase family protein [Alicyclobacillus tolerans]
MIRLCLSNALYTLISLALIGLPFYQNGIFFDQGHLLVDVILILCLAVTLVVLAAWRNRSSENDHSGAGPKPFNRYDAAFVIYVLSYVFSLLHTADFTRALVGALDALALVFPYLWFRSNTPTRFSGNIVILGIAISSVVINIIGMANAWHALTFPSAFDFTNHQVSSVFQYHNAYGSFVAAVSLLLLTYVAHMDIRKSWLSAVYTGIISINIAGLLVSDSRGALMFWIIALVLLFVGTKERLESHTARGQLLLLFYVSAIGVGAGYPFLHKGILSAKVSSGWLGIAITFVIPILLAVIIRLWTNRTGNRLVRWMTFNRLLPIGILGFIVAAAVKFHALVHKLQTYHANQLSVSQRFIFWKDGLKIWEQSPVFGLGANSWHTLYEKFQTYPYYSTRSHSFLVDTLMEVGLVGFIALLVVLWPMVRATVWPYQQSNVLMEPSEDLTERAVLTGKPGAFVPAFELNVVMNRSLAVMGLTLFLHSVMDWDMSFNYLRILMTIGMGAGVALYASREVSTSEKGNASRMTQWVKSFGTNRGLVYTASGIGAVALIVSAFFGTQLFRANQVAASAQHIPLSETTLTLYQKAHASAPYDAEFVADIAATENSFAGMQGIPATQARTEAAQALSTYEQAASLAPFDANIQGATATLAYKLGDFQLAYQHAKLAYEDAPFYPQNIEIAINGGAVYAMSIAKSNPTDSQAVFKDLLNLYQQYLQRDKVVQNLPSYLPPMNPYQLQPFTYDSLAAAALALKQPERAGQLAQKAVSSKDVHSKQLAQLMILIANRDLGQPVTNQQIAKFVAQNPGVQSSYKLLSNAIS